MSAEPFDEVIAVRYGSTTSRRSALYYRFHGYGEPDGEVRMDYYFWLLRRGEEVVVVDTGFSHEGGVLRRGRAQHAGVAEAMRRLGVEPEQVEDVIVTHLHYDHTGNLGLFGGARLHVDARELEFWNGPFADRPCFAASVERDELAHVFAAQREGRVIAVDPEQEVLPGVTAIRVGGHSPGQQILVVRTRGAEVVLTSDAAHYYEELALDRPFNTFADLEAAYAALARLRAEQAAGRTVVAGHDPEVMTRFEPVSAQLDGLAVRLGS